MKKKIKNQKLICNILNLKVYNKRNLHLIYINNKILNRTIMKNKIIKIEQYHQLG